MSETASTKPQRASQPDFLARVIDSAFERAIPLEPRLPSLFEPPAFDGAAAVAWSAEVEPRNKESAASELAEVELARERRAPREASRGVPVSSELPLAALELPSESPRRSAAEGVRAKVEPESRVPVKADARRDSRVEKAAEPKSPLADLPRGALVAERVLSTTQGMQPLLVPAPESRDPLDPAAQPVEDLREQRVAPALPTRKISVEPPSVRHRSAADALYAEVSAPSPEPVINVTIGRIEVRALQVQPASSRPRLEGPKPTSLGDYLKQRGAGR
jgi:hypothetical protein